MKQRQIVWIGALLMAAFVISGCLGGEPLPLEAPTVVTDPADVTNVPNDQPVQVTLNTDTAGATIYYTLDGSNPTTESTLYTDPFTVEAEKLYGETVTLKAAAFLDAQSSEVLELDIVFATATGWGEIVLFATDFSEGDPLTLDPPVWTSTHAEEPLPEYIAAGTDSYLRIERNPSSPGDFSRLFLLETWERQPDQPYILETKLRIPRMGTYNSITISVEQERGTGYRIGLGEYQEDGDTSFQKDDSKIAFNFRDIPAFENGAITSGYTDRWITVKVVLIGDQIDTYIDDVLVMSYTDADPDYGLGLRFDNFRSILEINSISFTTIGPINR